MRTQEQITVDDGEITLTQALKLAGWVGSGGEAKQLIGGGQVSVNGTPELRKRRQMAVGDVIEVAGGGSIVLVKGME